VTDSLGRTAERWNAIDGAGMSAQQAFVARTRAAADEHLADLLADVSTADAELRAAGFTATADRLVELFGAEWWSRRGR
jgi:hypothetical protein